MDINGYRGPEVALWSHNSPETSEIRIRGVGATLLEVWNAWSMGGVDTSWIGNAGIVTGNQHRRRNPTVRRIGYSIFHRLVVQISITQSKVRIN